MMVVGLSLKPLQRGESFADIFSTNYSVLMILGFVVLVLVLAVGAEKMNKMAFRHLYF